MKKKAVNQSMILLVLVVSFGLFQAWKESRNPFALYSNPEKMIHKTRYVEIKPFRYVSKNEFLFHKLNPKKQLKPISTHIYN